MLTHFKGGTHFERALRLKRELQQAQAENKRMVADLEEQTHLTEQAQARVKWLEALLEKVLHHTLVGHSLLTKIEAALAEGDTDGELTPEAERRLQESLKPPREELLTSEQMRQKLEDADAQPFSPLDRHNMVGDSA